MIKHATSHGLAVFTCTIAASFLVEVLKPKLPVLMSWINQFSDKILSMINVPFSQSSMSLLLVSSFLALIWGVFFRLKSNS